MSKFLLCFCVIISSGVFGQEIKNLTTITSDFQGLPATKWKFATKAPVIASPVMDEDMVYFGSLDSVLYALDTETGNMRWQLKTGAGIRSTVLIENSQLFLNGGDGIFYAINKKTGKVLWTYKTGGEHTYQYYGYADYYHSSPVLYKDKICFGSGDSYIYVLNASTGKLSWRFKTGDVVHATPVINGDKLFVGSFDGYLYALNAGSGDLIWKFKSVGQRFFPKGEMQGSPVIANNLVYIGSRDYNIYAIDIEKGYCHWNKPFPLGWVMALSARDSLIYAGTSDDDVMVSMDGKTGKENWRTNVQFNIFGHAVFSNSLMYFGTLMGRLHALDLKTGEIKWTFKTDGYLSNQKEFFPDENKVVKNDFYAYVKSPEGYIAALYQLGAIFSKPAISENLIILSSTDGKVYCLSRKY